MIKTGIKLIAEERNEQITKHGRSVMQDCAYNKDGQLAEAALRLIDGEPGQSPPDGWDEKIWDKMVRKPRFERLIIAGALLAAEVDRLIVEEARVILDE